jgi:uncharacterized protein (TIGR02266 family)
MSNTAGNKRQAARLHHQIPVAYRSVGLFLSDWATNISQGGLFINTRKPLPIGTEVRVLIQLPGEQFPATLDGRVTRISEFDNAHNQVPGMAVQFTSVDDDRRDQLERFVQRLRRDLDER